MTIINTFTTPGARFNPVDAFVEGEQLMSALEAEGFTLGMMVAAMQLLITTRGSPGEGRFGFHLVP